MQQLAKDLYLVASSTLTHPWDASAYVLTGPNPILIDCGGGLGHKQLQANIREIGIDLQDIQCIIATHCHWDHLAGAGHNAFSDVSIFLHPAEIEAAQSADERTCADWLYGQPYPRSLNIMPLVMGKSNLDKRIELIHTPGHSPGSCSLVVQCGEEKILLAADALWGGFSPRLGSCLEDWQDSLKVLANLKVDALHFGHAPDHLVRRVSRHMEVALNSFNTLLNPWRLPQRLED